MPPGPAAPILSPVPPPNRPAPRATWILHGGVIHTLDPSCPRAEAIALAGDRVALAGPAAEVDALGGPATQRLDLRGAAVFPGFIDAHAHVEGLGKSGRIVNLRGARGPAEAAQRVRAALAREPGATGWVEGRGWDQNEWPAKAFPGWRDLEGMTARPVALPPAS